MQVMKTYTLPLLWVILLTYLLFHITLHNSDQVMVLLDSFHNARIPFFHEEIKFDIIDFPFLLTMKLFDSKNKFLLLLST